LVGFNPEVKPSQDVLVTRWVSKVQIPELDASSDLGFAARLFGVNLRLLFNDTEDILGSLSSFRDAGHLTDADAASNSTDKHNITACEHSLCLCLVHVLPLYENSGDKEDETDENKANRLGVSEEETRNVSFLDVGLMGDLQESVVLHEHEFNILVTE